MNSEVFTHSHLSGSILMIHSTRPGMSELSCGKFNSAARWPKNSSCNNHRLDQQMNQCKSEGLDATTLYNTGFETVNWKCLFRFQRKSFAALICLNIHQCPCAHSFCSIRNLSDSRLLQMCLTTLLDVQVQRWIIVLAASMRFNDSKLTWKMKVLCSRWTFWEGSSGLTLPLWSKQVKLIFPVVLLSRRGQALWVCLEIALFTPSSPQMIATHVVSLSTILLRLRVDE